MFLIKTKRLHIFETSLYLVTFFPATVSVYRIKQCLTTQAVNEDI